MDYVERTVHFDSFHYSRRRGRKRSVTSFMLRWRTATGDLGLNLGLGDLELLGLFAEHGLFLQDDVGDLGRFVVFAVTTIYKTLM
jgi:hypothetical protein